MYVNTHFQIKYIRFQCAYLHNKILFGINNKNISKCSMLFQLREKIDVENLHTL